MSDLVQKEVFDRLPEKYQRRAREIAQRVAEIDAVLRKCRPIAIRDAAVRLRGQLRPQPDVCLVDFAEEFRSACADLPEWAVSEATNDFLAGRVENHLGQFMPTCAQFARHARSIIRPFCAERASLKNEAERLFDRAEDEERRLAIAKERLDPAVRERVGRLVKAATAGSAKRLGLRHTSASEEIPSLLDSYRKPRAEAPTRLLGTRLLKGKGQ